MSDELRKGLEGVLVAESGLSRVDGEAGRLLYRGYSIEDLASEATYEEVLYLLWHGGLPDRTARSSAIRSSSSRTSSARSSLSWRTAE